MYPVDLHLVFAQPKTFSWTISGYATVGGKTIIPGNRGVVAQNNRYFTHFNQKKNFNISGTEVCMIN